MNRRNDVLKIIKTIDELLHNDDIKISEIHKQTSISRDKLSHLRHGHKSFEDLTLRDSEKLCGLSDRIKRGSYVPEKVKTRQRRIEKEKAAKIENNVREYQELTPRQKQMLEDKGIDMEVYYQRRYHGWSFKEIVSRPVRKIKYLTEEERDQLKKNGISETTFFTRISRGWDRERALTEKTNR